MKIIGEEIDWTVPLSRYQYVTDGKAIYQVIGMVAYSDGNPVYIVRNQFCMDLIMTHAELATFSEKHQSGV